MSDQSRDGTTAAGISLSQVVGMLTKEPLAGNWQTQFVCIYVYIYMCGRRSSQLGCLARESLQ